MLYDIIYFKIIRCLTLECLNSHSFLQVFCRKKGETIRYISKLSDAGERYS